MAVPRPVHNSHFQCAIMHIMDWDALQAFLAVARTGRVSTAARRLGVEHTTVSRRISALEAELGVPLFYRTTGGYLLTVHGQNAVANAETMERAALGLAARAREGAGAVVGSVRLALAPEFASHWLAPKLAQFRDRHPGIALQLLVGTRQRNLARGEADLAIQSPKPRQQGLLAVRIARTTLALYAARKLAAGARRRVTNVESLRGAPLLVYTPQFRMLQEAPWFQELLAGARVALETNSTHALLAAAQAGAGFAVLPRFVARECEDLVEVSEPVAEHDVWLIKHPDFSRDPRVRVAADFLRDIAARPNGLC